MSHLKARKAAGESGILPELVRRAGPAFSTALIQLFHQIWQDEVVPKDWVDAFIVPIPKKGNLESCDNWRGIALLEVVGKLLARLIQNRLRMLAEDILPESQCGFRQNRGCTDMIFSVRQSVENLYEHREKGFFIFIDLRKAYDSVPRSALWKVLAKAGIPAKLITIIRSFHEGMLAVVVTQSGTTNPIDVNNGLRQGCSLSPLLFNIYMWAVFSCWLQRLEGVNGIGLNLRYKLDGRLHFRRSRRDLLLWLTDCQFADDSALVASTRGAAQLALDTFSAVASSFGLTVSTSKTKFMVMGIGVSPADRQPLVLDGQSIVCVPDFRYLGSIIHSDGRTQSDVDARIAAASRAFGSLLRPVFRDSWLTQHTKRLVYNACVVALLLYGSECWTPLRAESRRLNTFHHQCVRTVLGVSRKEQWDTHLTNVQLLHRWGDTLDMQEKVVARRLEWLGHVMRMEDERLPKCLLFSSLERTRPACGPRKRWRDCVVSDLRARGVADSWVEIATTSRTDWRQVIENVPQRIQRDRVSCVQCGRDFARPGDFKRHKCKEERGRPVEQQRGACHCVGCHRWFRSRGGLAVHRCTPDPEPVIEPAVSPVASSSRHHHRCEPTAKRAGQTAKHSGPTIKRPTVAERATFTLRCVCGRRFRRRQDLARHSYSCESSSSAAP